MVVERAASALAVHRLVARDRESLERHAHRTLLTELLLRHPGRPHGAGHRAAACRWSDRRLVGVAVRPRTASPTKPRPSMATQEVLRDLAEATALAARRARVAALVGVVDDTSVSALLSLTPQADVEAVLQQAGGQPAPGRGRSVRRLPVVVARRDHGRPRCRRHAGA